MGKGRIAVVENKRETRESLDLMLQAEGFEVLTAEHSAAVFELLSSFKPDLILTDLLLPLVAGENFIRALKHQPQLSATLIVVLTEYSEAFGEHAKAAGATAVLRTPRDLRVAIETVKNLLGKQPE